MKKLSLLLAAVSILMACNNEKKKDDKMGDEKKETKTRDNVTYPYKAEYSDFKMGDPNHTKLVLDFAKCWEENRMADMKALLADTVGASFADGSKFMGTADSLIKMGEMFRANYSSVKVRMDAFMPVHNNDKNEDYVLIWETDITTDKSGKVDSSGSHAFYQIKNNKIAFWGEYQQKLTAPPAMMDK
ncbi:MAG: hypothetical protein IPP43_15210 [Chitinophagaceae bacterium]|nr:hypothetical protein [Chitinophagaceae bacterium]MBK9569594.1 hypothetical protein [Chitinophagaceae bacterium]MBL0132277.1 hypothetical protein [Chitinophagaceae bacterium]